MTRPSGSKVRFVGPISRGCNITPHGGEREYYRMSDQRYAFRVLFPAGRIIFERTRLGIQV